MGSRIKRRVSGGWDSNDISLLDALFNIPNRRGIRRIQVVRRMKAGEDGDALSEADSNSSTDSADDEWPTSSTSSPRGQSRCPSASASASKQSLRQRDKVKPPKACVKDSTPPTRIKCTPRSRSKSKRCRQKSEVSTASPPLPSIPSSATFPRLSSRGAPSCLNPVSKLSVSSEPTLNQPPVAIPGQRDQGRYHPHYVHHTAALPAQMMPYQLNQFAHQGFPVFPQTPGYQKTANFACSIPPLFIPPPQPFNESRPQPPGLVAQEIQRLQKCIDEKLAELPIRAGQPSFNEELAVVRHQLDAALNAAGAGTPPQDAASIAPHPSQAPVPWSETRSDPMVDASADQRRAADKEKALNTGPQGLGQRPTRLAPSGQRDASPVRTSRHHLCSECGQVRSILFHSKHPLIEGQKRVTNYCEACRAAEIQMGVLIHHHFCFNCGIARSKAFQRQQSASVGDPLLPNYCSRCIMELCTAESIPDTSTIDGSIMDYPPQRPSKRHIDILQATKSSSTDVSQANGKIDAVWPPESDRARHKTSVDYLQDNKGSVSGKPASPALSSPFYPDRSLSSTQRRIQRGSAAKASPTSPSHDTPRIPKDYHSPYVEEVASHRQCGLTPEPTTPVSNAKCHHNRDDEKPDSNCSGGFGNPKPRKVSENARESLPRVDHRAINNNRPDSHEPLSRGCYSPKSPGHKSVSFDPVGSARSPSSENCSCTSSRTESPERRDSPRDEIFDKRESLRKSDAGFSPKRTSRVTCDSEETLRSNSKIARGTFQSSSASKTSIFRQPATKMQAKPLNRASKGGFSKPLDVPNGHPRGRQHTAGKDTQKPASRAGYHPDAFSNVSTPTVEPDTEPPALRSSRGAFGVYQSTPRGHASVAGRKWGQPSFKPSDPLKRDAQETAGDQ